MSSGQAISLLKTNRKRLFKEYAARYGVTAGGILVLVALLLIFFYLLYVVEPIFHPSSVTERQTMTRSDDDSILALGMEEQTEIGYVFGKSGSVKFIGLKGEQANQVLAEQQLPMPHITSFAQSAPHKGLYAVANDQGEVMVVRPRFNVTFPDNKRKITPELVYVTGETALQIEPEGQAIRKFAFAVDGTNQLFVFVNQAGQLWAAVVTGEENMMTEEVEWSQYATPLTFEDRVDDILITPDRARILVRSGNTISVFDGRKLTEGQPLAISQVLAANEENAHIQAINLLAGANSLMVVNSNGKVSQWFEVNNENGREFVKARTFATNNKAISALYPEYSRKTFFTVAKNGELGMFYTTSEATLWQGKVTDDAITAFAVAPRANAVMVASKSAIKVLDVHNEHPEVTWSALWHEVWYEGYPEPDYIWQSTSASDDFESKFSLMPIAFGTIKAALYAMLFAVPIALAAAVYTAYFMSPSLRKVVKPTVEIMEALPTVILGFLAGLWLAPLIEDFLPGIVMLLVMLPLAILATAFIWHKLPENLRHRLPEGMDSLLLVPVICVVGYVAMMLSGPVEMWLFNGDVRQFITNDLGIDFDQRNSLVVGIAMGFAVVPTIFSIAEDAVFSVPKHLSNGSLALGATQWQTLVRVVLLTASPGIFSAVMMGLGRAVGETMIVLMATGNTPIMDWSIFQGMRTLSANIAVEMPESEVGSSHYRILFLAALVLFLFTFIFNTVAEFVRQRLREKYSSL